MTAKQFFDANYTFAVKAGERFNINPAVILAVSSYETGYGGSYSAKNDLNYFGLSASSYFNSEFWNGTDKRKTSDDAGAYRVYKSVQNSFYDFAWLLSTASRYQSAYKQSYNLTLFADEFVKSGYFTGNKEYYKSALLSRSKIFLDYLKGVSAIGTGSGSAGTSQNAWGWGLGLLGFGLLLKNKKS